MAKHKAPTDVTVVSDLGKQGVAEWVERLWLPFVGLGVLIAAAILGMQIASSQREKAQAQSWRKLSAATQDHLVARGAVNSYVARTGDPGELESLAVELDESVAGPWARASLALSLASKGRYAEAERALSELRSKHGSSFLADARFSLRDGATPRSLLETSIRAAQDWEKFRAEHPALFQNPELAAGAPKVRIRTDKGNVLVGLYSDRAPKHVENFLQLCQESYYDGTAFHRVIQGFMVQGGDPNSRDDDVTSWGLGGPDEGVEAEKSGLRHFAGVLASAKSDPKGLSSGSQFYITTGRAHHLDADYTVFGRVLEGMDVIREIEVAPIVPGSEGRPEHPVRVLGTDVL